MNTFEYWKTRFDNNDLLDFSCTDEGRLWLKLRSIDRPELLAGFCNAVGCRTGQKKSAETIWKEMAYESTFESSLDGFLRACQKQENKNIDVTQEAIRSNLYKMDHFHWGGDFMNSLGRAIYS